MHFDPNRLFYLMAKTYSEFKARNERLVVCNEGGSRSSKTWDTFHLIIAICTYNINAGLDIYILRDTLTNCKDYTYKDFKKVIKLCDIGEDAQFSNPQKPNCILYGNNVYFRGLDDEKNTEGFPSDIIFINEVLETKKTKVDGLLMRCRKLVIFDWNPKLTKHWIFDYEGRKDVLFTHSTYKDNKHLEQTIVTEIEGYNPEIEANVINKTADLFRWKVYGLGVRADQEGNVFNDSELSKFDLKDIDLGLMTKIMWVDVADQGVDWLAAPIGAIDSIKTYVFDAVFSGKQSEHTIPMLIDKIIRYDLDKVFFESNNQGLQYMKNVLNQLKISDLENKTSHYDKFKPKMKAIPNTKNKHSRIILQAENNIIPNFYFLAVRTGQYAAYYDGVTNYKYDKSVKEDDAPDSTAGLSVLSQTYM